MMTLIRRPLLLVLLRAAILSPASITTAGAFVHFVRHDGGGTVTRAIRSFHVPSRHYSTSSATKLWQQQQRPQQRAAEVGEDEDKKLEEIRAMRAREIKQELVRLGVSANDIFEKEQLVQALQDARRRKQRQQQHKEVASKKSQPQQQRKAAVLETPLFLTTLDKLIQFNGGKGGEQSMTLEPNAHPYATIQLELQRQLGSSQEGSSSSGQQTLSLLLDTACSGIVLRPEVVKRYNLPELQTPVTMTGAAGTSGATGLTQLDSIKLFRAGESPSDNDMSFGPLPAAVQDIGALPTSLDGIIGLSFISQFDAMEIDLERGSVVFYRDEGQTAAATFASKNDNDTERRCVADGNLSLLPLGIYTVDVMLGERGPVKMIVDTGAACTLLNWKGVDSLGLSRSASNIIAPIPGNFGGLGADNQAIPLTHRLHVSSSVNLGSKDEPKSSSLPGLLLAGERISIDIGNIPILDGLRSHGVGGIIGMDVLMRCSSVKFHLKDPQNRHVELFQ